MKLRFLAGLVLGAVISAGMLGGEEKITELGDKTAEFGAEAVKIGSAALEYAGDRVKAVFDEIDSKAGQ